MTFTESNTVEALVRDILCGGVYRLHKDQELFERAYGYIATSPDGRGRRACATPGPRSPPARAPAAGVVA